MSGLTPRRLDAAAITGTVGGRVQGVGFRISTRWAADRVGVTGWVRNLPDGRVEVFAQGPAAAVAEFEVWLHDGPRAARVDTVHLAPTDPNPTHTTFDIR